MKLNLLTQLDATDPLPVLGLRVVRNIHDKLAKPPVQPWSQVPGATLGVLANAETGKFVTTFPLPPTEPPFVKRVTRARDKINALLGVIGDKIIEQNGPFVLDPTFEIPNSGSTTANGQAITKQ